MYTYVYVNTHFTRTWIPIREAGLYVCFGTQAVGNGEIKFAKRFSLFPNLLNDFYSDNTLYLEKCDLAVDFA